MPTDDDADDDGNGIGPPLPPDDRLWRHPSELTTWGPGSALASPAAALAPSPRRSVWPVAVAAGLVGAILSGAALTAAGTLTRPVQEAVVEKVALTPVVTNPVLQDEPGTAALAKKLAPAVVHLVVTTDAGTAPASGVVVRNDGVVYTSAHEVAGATSLTVELADGRHLEGEVIGADLQTDVAVVSIDADHLTVAVLGSSTDLAVGAPAIALGWPAGAHGEPSVTAGVVSAVERRLDVDGDSLHGLIQTNAPIEDAWSGGPLLDASGAVIGITTDLAGSDAAFGFAIPIDLVREIAAKLIESGKVAHGWLGIDAADLTMDDADELGVLGGAEVRAVAHGSPADDGGLTKADVITKVGERSVESSSGLVLAMRRYEPGDVVVITYWRDGAQRQATITVAEQR